MVESSSTRAALFLLVTRRLHAENSAVPALFLRTRVESGSGSGADSTNFSIGSHAAIHQPRVSFSRTFIGEREYDGPPTKGSMHEPYSRSS